MIVLAILLWSTTVRAERIDVIARVAEKPRHGVCGVIAVRTVVRFEVLEVRSGTPASRELFVGVWCPETKAVGAVYRLVLAPMTDKQRRQFDDPFRSAARRYRVVREKRLREEVVLASAQRLVR